MGYTYIIAWGMVGNMNMKRSKKKNICSDVSPFVEKSFSLVLETNFDKTKNNEYIGC